MRRFILTSLTVLILLTYGCTHPPQQAIVIQSAPQQQNLLPSPWPAYAHDAQHTGRGTTSGPKEPNIRWKFKVDNAITSFPVLSGDGTVYFCSGENKLYAVDAWGNRLWEKVTEGYVDRCLALAPDGTIYYGTSSGVFGALEPDGREKWTISLDKSGCDNCFIRNKSHIFVNSGGNIYSISSEGKAEVFCKGVSAVALAPDGTIYAISSDRKFLAINPDGNVLWHHDDELRSPASVDSEGTLYPCGILLYAISRDGSTKWKCKEVSPVAAPAAIAPDGILYAPSFDALHGVTRNGKKIWDFWMSTELQDNLFSSPIIDTEGTAYIGTGRGKFYAIDSKGKQKWWIDFDEEICVGAAMGYDGTLYVAAGNRLFAIGTALPKQTEIPNEQQESFPEHQQQSAKPSPAPNQLSEDLKKTAEELLKSLASEKYEERKEAIKILRSLLHNSGNEERPLVEYIRKHNERTRDAQVKHHIETLLVPEFGPWRYARKLRTLKLHSSDVTSVAFSPDGKLLASASLDRTVRIWNPSTGKCLRKLEGHEDWVWSVSFSPDGKTLATASEDKTIRLWNLTTDVCLQTIREHNGYVNSVAFSPDGKFLASGSSDTTVKIWNPETGKLLRTLRLYNGDVSCVAFSPDSKLLASVHDGRVILWDPSTGRGIQELQRTNFPVYASQVFFSPDSQLLVSASSVEKVIRVWNPATGNRISKIEGHTDYVRAVNFNPDGTVLASAGNDKTVKIWDSRIGKCLRTLKGHTGDIVSVVFTSDGQMLASGSDDGTIVIWGITEK